MIAKRLRQYRLVKGLTLKQVAQAAGVPVSTYRDWEYGKAIRGEPYERLARLFGVSIEELLTGKGPRRGDLLSPLEEARRKIEIAINIAKAL